MFNRYHPFLFKFCARYRTLEREHVADIVQQTFIKAFEKIGSLKDDRLFGSWFFMIARNEIVTYIRQEKKERLIIAKIVNDPTMLNLVEHGIPWCLSRDRLVGPDGGGGK
jgi:RNA polymerase sigma factor (sigma-70 family)